MVDFHSHILPALDDGAADVETSLDMLKSAYADGIDTVVSTSHLYIEDESDIDEFIDARAEAYKVLTDAMAADGGKFPEIKLGCEVRLKPHIGNYDSVARLAIEGTNYILLEMPYSGWSNAHYEAIYNITVMGLRPIMAHIERFLRYKSEFHHIKSLSSLFQVNAESFLHKPMRKALLQLYYDGYIHVLGSDMHNMNDRKNNLKEAYEIIEGKYGSYFAEYTEKAARAVLENSKPEKAHFPKLGFFDKIKL